LRQLSCGKPLDKVLLDGKKEAERVALDEHEARKPEPVVEGECEAEKDDDG